MTIKIRSKLFFYYRLFYIALFLLLGFTGMGIVALENYAQLNLISTNSDNERQALHAVLSVLAVLGFFTAFIMIYLMQERRSNRDRRQQAGRQTVPDQRGNNDRRAAWCEEPDDGQAVNAADSPVARPSPPD